MLLAGRESTAASRRRDTPGEQRAEVHLPAVRSPREDGCLSCSGKRQLTQSSPIVSRQKRVNTATPLFTLDF